MTSPDYKSLLPFILDHGALYIPLDKLLATVQSRATILATEAARPGLDPIKTELVRGRREECVAILAAFKDRVPEPRSSGELPDLNLV